MSPFRGTDEALDREIAILEEIARIRRRRYAEERRALRRDLEGLRREQEARRGGRAQ